MQRTNKSAQLPIGYVLHGTYRIDSILGQGGFGITYLATDLGLDRKVAVKEFFPKDFCDRDEATSQIRSGTASNINFVEKLKEKFLKEARNIAGMNHANIIRIHAAFEENNTAYYVMEYIKGCSLADMVKAGGPLKPAQALQYISGVGRALEFVHDQHVNHLDVKPANIMIKESTNEAILIDFGLSKKYDSEGNQTSTSPTGISHGFAPIEQYQDGGVSEFSPQTDIYSLAATFYYITTGKVPPQAGLLIDERLQFPDFFPKALIRPVSKAMAPGRRNRHTTVRAFIYDLSDPESHADEGDGRDTPQDFGGFTPPVGAHTPKEPVKEDYPKEDAPVPVDFEPETPHVSNPRPHISNPQPHISQPDVAPVYEENEPAPGVEDNYSDGGNGGAFNDDYNSSEPDIDQYYPPKKSRKGLWIVLAILAAIGIGVALAFSLGDGDHDHDHDGHHAHEGEHEDYVKGYQVENMHWESPLGAALYTGSASGELIHHEDGSIDADHLVPDGNGKANIIGGKYAGNTYEGSFVNGHLEGNAVYIVSDGDKFEGTFHNDKYEKGRYTVKKTGQYFEGTFKNGSPDKGSWYDSKGRKL